MDFYSTAVAYFDAFSNKDLGRLEELYAKNIYLRDWEGTYVGAMPVLKANKELFDNVDTIIVRPVVLHFDVDDIHMRMHIIFHENFTHRKPDKLRVSISYKEQ